MINQEKILLDLLKAEIDPAFRKRAEFIFNQVFKNKAKSILDIGCGRGFYSNALATLPYVEEIIAIDLKKENLATAKKQAPNKKVKYYKANIYNWSSPKKFDLIIASEVLEHLENEKDFLRRVYNLLKNKAKLIITVPSAEYPFFWDPLNYFLKFFNTHVNKDIWFLAGIWADHERLYKEKELVDLLSKSNFKKLAVKKALQCCWPFSHFIIYGLGKNLVLKLKIRSFDRFSLEPKPLAKLLADFFIWPDKISTDFFNFKRKKLVSLMGSWTK
jgi:2-polyprenyl-6-hydroxyphenyl methylase / 3-demethylubiquinone-9 3-methyltransferase